MLGWFRKKLPAPAPAGAKSASPAAGAPARTAAPAPPPVDWGAKLRSADGNDEALLALLIESAPIDIKIAAVDALESEDALKRAERELRTHDRRAHRLAKQRLATLLARREAQARAAQLAADARALLGEPVIAANRIVELDRAWQALDAALLDDGQASDFNALLARLTTLARERADHALAAERWMQAARKALDELRSASENAAAVATANADATATAPASDTLAAAEAAARNAQSVLDAAPLQARDADDPPDVTDGVASPELAALCEALRSALQANAALAARLAERALEIQRAPPPPPPETPPPSAGREPARQHDAQTAAALAQAVEDAEAALAEGHVVEAGRQLAAIDAMLHDGARAGALRARVDRLHAEVSRLKGWQHWGGRLARDELVAQAEALATAGPDAGDAQVARLTTRQRAELISEMRARWKELDRVGGASNRDLWQRFEAALKTAYEPVAAQAQAQREARAQNLQARLDLLSQLEAVALPESESARGATQESPQESSEEPAQDPAQAKADWKSVAAALGNFQAAWRKLGPLEHTVPRAERDAVQTRLDAALARLDAPLTAARNAAQAERKGLIARALALTAAGAAAPQGRDGFDKLRALQAEWQQAAKALPLTRAAENALWTEFKAAIDAAHAARNAAFDARDAEFKAQGAARQALIERLDALTDATPAGDIRRTLADVESAWRQAGPAPRAHAAALDARYRAACDAARARLAGAAQRAWRARCDALLARFAAQEEPVLQGPSNSDDVTEVMSAQEQPAQLPASWEQALARRASSANGARGALADVSSDELLLQLEAALGLASPQGSEAARRELKLRAMKAALESRATAAPGLADANALLVEALARAAFDVAQQARLRHVIEAMRELAPLNVE
ncbi:MAG: DUF349 domain-containing protein [Rhizobacter sp.]|nr:DUF349 domain-containing protein [Rhizobacter sp.]